MSNDEKGIFSRGPRQPVTAQDGLGPRQPSPEIVQKSFGPRQPTMTNIAPPNPGAGHGPRQPVAPAPSAPGPKK